ncbi:DUF6083 domain-containing protein [Streptomyces sp. NPDC056909]|uniref:DUF6083 domain-containing protein n=1 Tax=Streptomyces sp. NPDC056909 TaxID=3345963 RepID=UPI0036BFB390
MTIDIHTAAAPTINSQQEAPATPCCPSCGLPGDLLATPEGRTVLLDSNDPTAPLRAGDVPSGFRWTLIDYYAHRLPDSAAPTAPCQVDHALVCPRSQADLASSALQQRRLLNEARRRRAEELFEADPTDTNG